MKRSMKRHIALAALALALALLLSGCGGSGRRAAQEMEIAATQLILPALSAAPEASAPPVDFSAQYQPPCVDAPYDYQYSGQDKQILIRRYQLDGVAYLIADVQLTDAAQFQTALSGGAPEGDLETVSAMAQRSGAVLAVNADDYGVHKYGTIIRGGELLRAHDTTRHMLIVDANGDFSIRTERRGEDAQKLGQELLSRGVRQSFEFGPELIRDGKAVAFGRDFDLISTKAGRREPRTAIGQIGPLHYALIVADGRQGGYSKGMTLAELQRLFIDCGAQTAMNLDGGGSTEMWFEGEIINRPSEGRERRMSDILFF